MNFQVEKRLSDVQKFFFRVEGNGDETQCILVQYYCILPRHSCRFYRFPNMQQSSITTDTFLISLIIDTIYISCRLAGRFCCHIPDVFLYGFFSSSSQLAIKSCRFHIHHILQLCFVRNNVVSLIGSGYLCDSSYLGQQKKIQLHIQRKYDGNHYPVKKKY